jgi:hypothetical protein
MGEAARTLRTSEMVSSAQQAERPKTRIGESGSWRAMNRA